jgi:BlaI family transcriptional regulator, penicillinase repressor
MPEVRVSAAPRRETGFTKTYLHSSIAYEDNFSMKPPRLTKLELQIMEVLWTRGPCAIREIQEAFPKRARPAYSTIQTTVYRLEEKKTLRRVRKISHAHIFEASISRGEAQGKLIDDLLSLLGDKLQPVMAHLIESRRLTLDDVREAEKTLLLLQKGDENEEKQ